MSQDAEACRRYGLRKVDLDGITGRRMAFEKFGTLGAGGNSGFQAVNLAVQTGAARVALIGFDMNLAGGIHWHGRHKPGLNNPTTQVIAGWRQDLDAMAPKLAALGVEVVNLSAQSALAAYPRMTLEEALS